MRLLAEPSGNGRWRRRATGVADRWSSSRKGYRTRLTRRPRPTPLALNSVSSRSTLLEGTIREQLVEKAAVEGDLLCPFRPKTSSRRALVNMRKAPLAWSTVLMPSVSSWFPLLSEPRSRRPPKRFKPDDARVRTVRHGFQMPPDFARASFIS